MQCISCGASILADDKFCEECGTALTTSQSPQILNGCAKCGANIGTDGYCQQCGFRQELQTRDWLEVVINTQLAGVSDRGLKHCRNEDSLALQQLDHTQHHTQSNILIVCDGVSSSQKPDQAAKIAAESVCSSLVKAEKRGENLDLAIKSAFDIALKEICNITYVSGVNHEPPSTTIVAAVVQAGMATIGWLGDSRAYWISAHSCQQLTQDDSWLTAVVAAGEMSEIQARESPQAHAITRWLGADALNDAVPSVVNFTIPSSGYLILCTDGLWNYTLDVEHLANLVQRSPSLDAVTISRTLVEFALNSGGHDNITVAVLCL